MVYDSVQNLKQVAHFLQIPVNNVQVNEMELLSCTVNKKKICGFVNIISELVNKSSVLEKNSNSEIYQWLEYALVYASDKYYSQVLQELNSILVNRTYLVLNCLTVADVVLFYYLHNIIANFTNSEKEQYLNVCRWFDNLQQNNMLRSDLKLVNFNTNYLLLNLSHKK